MFTIVEKEGTDLNQHLLIILPLHLLLNIRVNVRDLQVDFENVLVGLLLTRKPVRAEIALVHLDRLELVLLGNVGGQVHLPGAAERTFGTPQSHARKSSCQKQLATAAAAGIKKGLKGLKAT